MSTVNEPSLSLNGATIVTTTSCDDTIAYAAAELSRFLYVLYDELSPILQSHPDTGPVIVLLTTEESSASIKDQGFKLTAFDEKERSGIVVSSSTPGGVLHGVYRLLEELGMGFYAGGETYPDLPACPTIPVDFELYEEPVFAVRGNMLHYNFLCGPTNWGLSDYKFYFDQLARMRCNMLIMHWYDGEPGAAYQQDGEYKTGGPAPDSLSKPWGARAALRTSEFSFGSGQFFSEEVFTSPMAADAPDLLSEIRESERIWCEATRYARRAGINIAAGFEAPRGDPTDLKVMVGFGQRVRQFLARNPHLTHFSLWQHEAGASSGSTPPQSKSAAAELLESQRSLFAHLGNDHRVWEAIRYGAFAQEAAAILADERPELRLLVIGWGGDRWMRFAELCLGYDKILPPDVIFTCHDNIDASFGSSVSTQWGELPASRERWAMPWVEGDIDDCMVRQPNVEILGTLAPDALNKGCQGLLTLQWRTRDVEEETGYIANFAWNPSLTPKQFYHRFARHSFGPSYGAEMGSLIEELQQFGARWSGVRGCGECSHMQWTGWTPHFPFDLDTRAIVFLEPMAEAAINALATIPGNSLNDGDGAFHERSEKVFKGEVENDFNRTGICEFQKAIQALRELTGVLQTKSIRDGLIEIEESIWAVRPDLVARGMSSPCYQAVDKFLIAIHHLQRNAGATHKMGRLREIHNQLATLRQTCETSGQIARLERIDYLAATIGFVLSFDSTAMLMADNERVELALKDAEKATEEQDRCRAATIAANAYREVIAAGMQDAVDAFSQKLTTRCDFGTLTTINVKPLPLYWEILSRLEHHLPATPPREINCRGFQNEVWISWQASGLCTGQNLYRRLKSEANWHCVNTGPLGAGCKMFVDHPPESGHYVYAVTVLDGDGWESPHSHLGRASYGDIPGNLKIIGCKPFNAVTISETFAVRAVVIAERELSDVTLSWRRVESKTWQHETLRPGFRNSYEIVLPRVATSTEGVVQWYVTAEDSAGTQTNWPESAATNLPFSLVILSNSPAS